MRTGRFLLGGLLAGMGAGYLLGLWGCVRMHAASPGGLFTLADSVYEIATALAGAASGLLVGGVCAFITRRR